MGVLRFVGLALVSGLVWMAGASSVPSHVKLPVYGVVAGARVSQPFGCTDLELEPFSEWCPTHHFHSGIDLAAPQGTDVYSATSGVAQAGYDSFGAGQYVVVRVDKHVRILYCHLARIAVRSGTQVEPGQLIGTVGATGLATGPHLHLEVQVDGLPVDPAAWLGP